MALRRLVLAFAVVLAASVHIYPQDAASKPEAPPAEETHPFRLGGEIKFDFRNSDDVSSPVYFPFPPEDLPASGHVVEETVSPGSSLEVANVALRGEGDLTSGVTAKVEVHFLDLDNRNPTSSDNRILLREAWIRFGKNPQGFAARGTNLYVLLGLAPRFTKQTQRHLESYGLWGTAVGRFEQPQIQLGGNLGHVYWRGMFGNGNPLFFRDPNALAGDNGTPQRVPGNVNPIYNSGFPILYDTLPTDLNFHGDFEWGGGAGFRAGTDTRGLDVLGWGFGRRLEDTVRLIGTFYGGDLKLLEGFGFPLPISGDRRHEYGLNVEGRLGVARLHAQYIQQTIANLPRKGPEVELAFRLPLNGLFLIGESPALNWIQPVVRVSHIENDFTPPHEYPGLSVGWNWTKVDFGVRIGIVREVDLTAEYSYNDAKTSTGSLHPNETLVTLRAGF